MNFSDGVPADAQWCFGESEEPEPVETQVIISDVDGLPADAVTIRAMLYDSNGGEEIELDVQNVENGGVTIELPVTVADEYLNTYPTPPSGIELSDDGLRWNIIYFMVFDSSGYAIGDVYFENETTWTYVWYADRECTISGSHLYESAGYTESYDLHLKKGCNWIQEEDSPTLLNTTDGLPADGAWVYVPLPF
jgi:hypothetical protein